MNSRTCLWCHKEIHPKRSSTNRKYCNKIHADKFQYVRNILAYIYQGEQLKAEFAKFQQQGKDYKLPDNKRVCLFCKKKYESNYIGKQQKFCCETCRTNFATFMRKINTQFMFDDSKLISEREKLEIQGFKYKLPERES